MRITIHIGTYKTATSAIQFALARSERVLARVGAKYAQTGLNVGLSKHLHLFDRIIDGGYNTDRHQTHRGEDYIGGLLEEVRDPAVSHLLISEEELSYPSAAIAQYLAPLRAEADIEIVMVVRRQPEFLESLYLQFLKEPLREVTSTFAEFLQDEAYIPRGDFAALLEPWEEVFGADAIVVADFDDLKRDDVVSGFASLVGLPHNLTRPDHVINPSATPAAAELLRLIGRSEPAFPRMQLASLLQDMDVGRGTTLLTPEVSALVLDTYRDSNRRLADRHGVVLDREAPPGRRPIDEAELEHLALEAAAQIIGVLWQRSRKAAAAIREISGQQNRALGELRNLLRPDG
jgi:hypothetical protein